MVLIVVIHWMCIVGQGPCRRLAHFRATLTLTSQLSMWQSGTCLVLLVSFHIKAFSIRTAGTYDCPPQQDRAHHLERAASRGPSEPTECSFCSRCVSWLKIKIEWASLACAGSHTNTRTRTSRTKPHPNANTHTHICIH